MKKIILIILIFVAGFWVVQNQNFLLAKLKINQEKNLLLNNSQIKQPEAASSSLQQAIAQVAKQVFTGGTLRGKINNEGGSLSIQGVLDYTNQNRASSSKASLILNNQLNKSAQLKLDDMFKQQYFEHISPQGKGPSDLAKDVGYEFVAVGENLAMGNFKNDADLVAAWMNSPGHKANILNSKFTQIGIAVGQGMYEGHKIWMAVQEFGKPASACPIVDENLKAQIESEKIDLNNQESILSQTKSTLTKMPSGSQTEVDLYNQKVAEYNNLVHIYNNSLDKLKLAIQNYNNQISAYNFCIK